MIEADNMKSNFWKWKFGTLGNNRKIFIGDWVKICEKFPIFRKFLVDTAPSEMFISKYQLTYTVLIVWELNLSNTQVLSLVQILFLSNYSTIEELLQLLVTIVDTELLERVLLKVLWEGSVTQSDGV